MSFKEKKIKYPTRTSLFNSVISVPSVLKYIFCFSLFLFPALLHAQKDLPLNDEYSIYFEHCRNTIKADWRMDSTVQKGNASEQWMGLHSLWPDSSSCFRPYIVKNIYVAPANSKKNLFIRKLKYENLLIVNDTADKFYLTADPLFDLQYGNDKTDSLHEKNFTNTRGILLRGDVGSKFSFESTFYENQASFPAYIDSFNQKYSIIPGQGRWKPFKVDTSDKYNVRYDYAIASGYVSYSPNRHFNFQAGHGKHFIGDGYRSLLLSDNAFNYPFARISSTFGKFQYTNLYTVFMNLVPLAKPPGITDNLYQKKAGNFQFLSWNVCKRFQLGFFQAAISNGSDKKNRLNPDASFFDPIIFGNVIQYGLDNTYNILLGSTAKIKITNAI